MRESVLTRASLSEIVHSDREMGGHPDLRLLSLVSADELEQLRTRGEAELQEPGRWGTTFTLLQCWGRFPA